jgi:ABC-type nitrate/sulfonate/bicarbonate transport system permease component
LTNGKPKRLVTLLVFLGLAGLWQIASMLVTYESRPGEPMVPGWQVLATRTVLTLADYWPGGLGIRGIAEGGSRTYAGAALAVATHSIDTSVRLYSGLIAGSFIGIGTGLAVSWSTWTRRLVTLPGRFLRTFPLLALIPLFQLWFGIGFLGMMSFVAFAVAVILFTGTINAVSNVSPLYVDYAMTLGASRTQVYRSVVLPAMFPELRSSILLALGLAWTAVVGAEFLGAQTGLGQIIVYAKAFGYVDRMFLVGLILLTYAAITYAVFERISRRMTIWMPQEQVEHIPMADQTQQRLLGADEP